MARLNASVLRAATPWVRRQQMRGADLTPVLLQVVILLVV